jgi:hypothetical protein
LTVLVFSEAANASRHILREVRQAADTGIPILPFRITGEHPSDSLTYYIGDRHWLDALSPPLENHLERLAQAVRERLGEPPPDDPPPDRRDTLPRFEGRTAATKTRSRLGGSPRLVLGAVGAAVAIAAVVAVGLTSLGSGDSEPATDASSPTQPTAIAGIDPAATTEPVVTTATALEALDWIHNPTTGHYYAVTRSGLSWNDLDALAAEYGGYLVSIGDAAEEEWLYSHFGQDFFWIGLTDKAVEDEWVWTSGEPVTYLNWCPGEPTDIAGGAGTEDAVHTIPFMQCWNDDLAWATEFLADYEGNMTPSFPGVIELDHDPGVP